MIIKKGRYLLGICNACMKYGMRFHAKTCTLGSMIDGRGEVLALLKSSCSIDHTLYFLHHVEKLNLNLLFSSLQIGIWKFLFKSWFAYFFQYCLVIKYYKLLYRKKLKKNFEPPNNSCPLEVGTNFTDLSSLSFYTLILSKSHFWKFSSSQNRNWEFMTSNPFGDSKYTWWTFCKKQLNRLTKPFKTFWQQMQKGD